MAKFGYYKEGVGGAGNQPNAALLAEFDGDHLLSADSGVVRIIDNGNKIKSVVHLRPRESGSSRFSDPRGSSSGK
jgi:hypothetical protein